MDVTSLHRRSVESWQRYLDGVGAEQWNLPTPCTEWDVRALVNHVVGEERWTAPLLDGMTIAEVGDRFDGDLLGADPQAAGRAAAAESTAAVANTLADIDVVHLSYGDEDPAEYVRQLSADHLIHGWDLAAATGQDRTLDPELVAEVAAWFADREELFRSAGIFGPRTHSAGDPQSDLLAASGRAHDWVPGPGS
jgi:uncharacterized protein (TIGR03086 family)